MTVLPPDAVKDEVDAELLMILNCQTPAERTELGLIWRRESLITPQLNPSRMR